MKKIYTILATAAILAGFAACTKVAVDENVATPDLKIGYQVATYLNQTKSAHGHTSFLDELTELGINSNQSFNSAAYIHAAQADGTVAAPAAFFNAGTGNVEAIKWDDTNKEWAPAHPYYWPKSPKSSLSFFSWYDFTGANPTVTYTADGGTATLAWADRAVALKDNVLYADAAYHFRNNDQASHKLDGVSEGVPTLFHHALAKVRFTVKAKIVEKEDTKNSGYKTFWKVTLADVALSSGTIKSKGTLSLTQTSSTSNNTVVGWTLPANSIWGAPTGTQAFLTANLGNVAGSGIFDTDVARGAEVLTTTAVTLTGDNYMDDNYFTVLPQDVAAGVTLTFKYTVETRYGNSDFDSAAVVSVETININDYGPSVANLGAPYTDTGIQLNNIGSSPIVRWQMNHRYVYNIIIDPETSTILYDPAVEDWAAEESSTVTVPEINS